MLCPLMSICQMSTAVDSAMGYQVTGCCEYTPDAYESDYVDLVMISTFVAVKM